MHIDQERLNDFQARMSDWVAGQGLFFQLRYGGSIQGAQSSFGATLMRLVLRLGVVLVILLIGFWIYLAKRVDFVGFRQEVGEQIALSMRADSAVVGSVKRERGQANMQRVSLEGGEKTFFYSAELRQLRTDMGLLDGVVKRWGGDSIQIKELQMSVKSGADSDEAAAEAYQALFAISEAHGFSLVEVESASLDWGYSELHRGSIQGARMKASRKDDGGWTLEFKGGFFTQNWMRRFAIERLEVVLTEDSFEIAAMELAKGGGSVSLTGNVIAGGASPEFSGEGRMASIPVWAIVDAEFHEFIGGQISGDFKWGGFTNSQEGFWTEMEVELEAGDHVVLEDRFPLLRAISAVDRHRSYKKVRFGAGSLTMKTGGDRLELSDVSLRSQDIMELKGGVVVRPPTPEELQQQRARQGQAAAGGRQGEDDAVDLEQAARAAAARREEAAKREERQGRSLIVGSQLGTNEVKDLNTAARVRDKEAYYFDGAFSLGVTGDVFERSPVLDAAYPVDEESGLRWIKIEMGGGIYSIGADLAKKMVTQSRGSE